ncbi:hypothetical protein [Streptomyces sp. NPDC004014]
MPRAAGLAPFGALASVKETLHANPGGRGGFPAFELDGALRFFALHLN